MSLKENIATATKEAMRARDSARVTTLRMLSAAIQQLEIDNQKPLTDEQTLSVIEKQVKQLRESSAIYEQAGRQEQAASDLAEIEVLLTFLPKQADDAEIDTVIEQTLADLGAQGVQGPALMGRAMGALKQALAGRADMGQVSARVKARLG
ncbi:GatB/YqeY domain-containing protein [Orrella sp. 11846]|uniref:GatB/YqeY domain-containing protein n=1 Tax=Orrella sp. 11846 TaxID=3409913 RepID=UPI003B5A9C89